MGRAQISIRLGTDTKDRLVSLAKYQNKTYCDLIRDKINELINNGVSLEIKGRAKKICTELREPFTYVKNPIGKARAVKERDLREAVAKRIETVFNIGK